MKAIKDYNGEYVFIGDPDNDKEAKEVMDRIKKEAYAVGKVWAYKRSDGFGAMIYFKELINSTPEEIRPEALLSLLETIARTVADALNTSTVHVLSVINTKIIVEAMQRQKEEE